MTLIAMTVNRTMLSVAAMLMNIRIMDAAFQRRHSLAIWAVYFGAKAVLSAFFDAGVYMGVSSSMFASLRLLFLLVTAAASYAVLYYTWKGDILGIGCIALCSDIVTGSSFFLASSLINTILQKDWKLTFIGMTTGETLGTLLLSIAIFLVLLHLVRSLLHRIGNHAFQRRGLWAGGIIGLISALTFTQVIDIVNFTASQFVDLAVFLAAAVGTGAYLTVKIPREVNRRTVLRQQSALTDAYNRSIRAQTEELYEQQRSLEEIAGRIEETAGASTEEMQRYLEQMKSYLERLRGGKYSADPATDAVLTAFAEAFREKGIEISFHTASLSDAGSQAAELAGILLHWAEHICMEAPLESTSRTCVHLRILRRRNQLIMVLRLQGVRKRAFPGMLLHSHLSGRRGILKEAWEDGEKRIRLMTEVSA
ncbi:MAG: hypothetical protein IJ109_03365 [Firmicutes bacterium]|nr:hypothetical protein [Bacillota bacterium]